MRTVHLGLCLAAVLCLSSTASAQASRPALPPGADTTDWNAYYERGVMMLRGAPAVADALFRWASRLDPSRPEPLYGSWVAFHVRDRNRFLHYLRRDDARVLRDSALIAAEALQLRALARNPFLHQGLLAAAYAQLPGGWPRDPFTQAFLKYVRGDLEGAAADLAELVRTSRDPVPARHSLALTLANLRRYDEARAQLDTILATLRRRDESGTPFVYQSKGMLLYKIGLLYLVQNRYAEAREAFAQAVVEDASQWYAHRGLGLTLRTEGRAAEAVGEYRAALELAPDEPLLLGEYAEALAAADDHAAAAEALERLVTIAPEWAAARRMLAEERARLNR